MKRKRVWEVGAGMALGVVLGVVVLGLLFGATRSLHQNNLNFSVAYNLMVLRRAPAAQRAIAWTQIKNAIRSGARVETRGKIFPKAPPLAGVAAEGCTPLLVAAEMGDTAFVDELLQRGADANAVDNSGSTPLSVARKNRHPEVVRLLKQHGATR